MREVEAKKLKTGDRVQFRDELIPNEDNGSLGTVVDRDYSRFMVKWDDGMQLPAHFGHGHSTRLTKDGPR